MSGCSGSADSGRRTPARPRPHDAPARARSPHQPAVLDAFHLHRRPSGVRVSRTDRDPSGPQAMALRGAPAACLHGAGGRSTGGVRYAGRSARGSGLRPTASLCRAR